MLLALDVGNTNTVLGLYRLDGEKPDLAAHWRVTTHRARTVDEYGVLFINLFELNGMTASHVTHIIVASVVPPVDSTLRRVCEQYFHIEPMFVEPGIKTGMPMLVDNPTELGADRLADSVAAYVRYGGPCIVVDFGTATKFEVISARGEYLGGAIAPGLGLSADALFSRAARLTRVDIKRPAKVIGTNTVGHLQSGIFFGYIGLVDGIIERILNELGAEPRIVATGGLARMIAPDSRYIQEIDDMLTLDGLRILFERNRGVRPRGRPHDAKSAGDSTRPQSATASVNVGERQS
ncbi:MAG TPA: type III pantothenate kinase [Terracidiphilus sp.]|jgi:type III pantothenate kinase|nr:type III pantothenate kinase [Terracidiphilus sp.]